MLPLVELKFTVVQSRKITTTEAMILAATTELTVEVT